MNPDQFKQAFGERGLNKLEYFAAHAPAEPLWEFDVQMIMERPKLPDGEEFNDDRKLREEWNHLKNHDGEDYGRTITRAVRAAYEKRNEVAKQIVRWDDEKKRQRLIQWPWAWARAVLGAKPE